MRAFRGLILLAMLCVLPEAGAVERTIVLTERLGHHWKDEWLRYEFKFEQGVVRSKRVVAESDGRAMDAQMSGVEWHSDKSVARATVSFVTDLPARSKRRVRIHFDRSRAQSFPDLTLLRGTRHTDIRTSWIGMRVPLGNASYEPPQPVEKVPAPIKAIRLASGKWIGRGWLESDQKVKAWRAELVEEGPVFAEAWIQYKFEQGRYAVRLRLVAGDPVIRVYEEYDLGPAEDDRHRFCLSFHENFEPDAFDRNGRAPRDPSRLLNEGKPLPGRGYASKIDYAADYRAALLIGYQSWWPDLGNHVTLYREKGAGTSDAVGVFRRHASRWRNACSLRLEVRKKPEVFLALPISVYKRTWDRDGIDVDSQYYTGTTDPDLKPAEGRRCWGLVAMTKDLALGPVSGRVGSGVHRAMLKYGETTLDEVKDWVLEWPLDRKLERPRLYVTREGLGALRERVASHPVLQGLVGADHRRALTALVTGDKEWARKTYDGPGDENWEGVKFRLKKVIDDLLRGTGELGQFQIFPMGNRLRRDALSFDTVLAMDVLDSEERDELRAMMAFLAHKLASRNHFPHGTSFHLGNPNMPLIAESTLGLVACALGDHPSSRLWAKRAADFLEKKLSEYTEPGGAWEECPHYQMDASMNRVLDVGVGLKIAGVRDLFAHPALKATMKYHAQLLTPVDPRFGCRLMPPVGNTSNETTSLYGVFAFHLRELDPDLSRFLMWAWHANGSPLLYEADPFMLDPSLAAEKGTVLDSEHFQGYGAVMRAHFGSRYETYLSFRCGRQSSHYEYDQGSLHLYGKGAPLCLDFASMYSPGLTRPWYHNRVSVDHKAEDHAQTGEIIHFAALGDADLALSRQELSRLFTLTETPAEKMPPNATPPMEEIPPLVWYRSIFLLKDVSPLGPNYVVLRDSFAGETEKETDWNLWCLAESLTVDKAKEEVVSVAGKPAAEAKQDLERKLAALKSRCPRLYFKGQYGIDLDVFFAEPTEFGLHTDEFAHQFLYGGMRQRWEKWQPARGAWQEKQKLLRVKQGPGLGYFTVLYPRLPHEAAPKVSILAEGAGVQIETPSGVHRVFLSAKPINFTAEAVRFEGKVGAIRQAADGLHLTLGPGGGKIAGSGYQLETPGPISVLVEPAGQLSGRSDGPERPLSLTVPANVKHVLIDGERVNHQAQGNVWQMTLPAGRHQIDVR